MEVKLGVWFMFEILREYPRTVHIFLDYSTNKFKAEIYSSGGVNSDAMLELEYSIIDESYLELMCRIMRYMKNTGEVYDIHIRYDAGYNDI